MRGRLRWAWTTLRATLGPPLKVWQGHDLQIYAAALAFFGLLAVGPLSFMAMHALRWACGTEGAVAWLAMPLRALLGPPAARSVVDMLRTAPIGDPGRAALFGLSTYATGLLGLLSGIRGACGVIWQTRPNRDPSWRARARRRAKGLVALGGLGALFLLSLTTTAALTAHLGARTGMAWPAAAAVLAEAGISWAVLAALCMATLHAVPDVELTWRDVSTAGAAMALLLTLGKWGIGLYLTWDDLSVAYGTAGTLATAVTWLYWAAQAFLVGAVLAHQHAQGRPRGVPAS